jgi:hypothetical protein
MNVAANAAVNAAVTAAIAAQMARQRKLVQRLHDEGATTPERAQPLSKGDARLVKTLVREGVVMEASPGAFHVDPARYAWWTDPERGKEKAKKALLIIGTMILLMGALIAGIAIAR